MRSTVPRADARGEGRNAVGNACARHALPLLMILLAAHPLPVSAGGQQNELLSASTRASLSRAIADRPAPADHLRSDPQGQRWLDAMVVRLGERVPGKFPKRPDAVAFLNTVHYEAQRAGLDPQLVLALIDVESHFRKYAVSGVGARGYMQVMPFWVKEIGDPAHNLFSLRTNLRYGCIILRYYLDRENGNLARALARYNGSLGKSEYSDAVSRAWHSGWKWS